MKSKYYYSDGTILDHYNETKTLHREGGPAVEYTSGTKCWYLNGKCHREDGPAVEWANGDKEWWLNGAKYTEKEYNKLVPLDLDFDL